MFSQHRLPHIISFFMAFFMSAIMSLVITTFNIGLVSDLFIQWLHAWAFAFAVALPTIFIVAPLVRKLSMRLVQNSLAVQ